MRHEQNEQMIRPFVSEVEISIVISCLSFKFRLEGLCQVLAANNKQFTNCHGVSLSDTEYDARKLKPVEINACQ